ncbi:glycosyltransferase family 2 protein [Dyella flagellata]|uniref:Glycosyl transferase n=1 Tax=Dyella flagellata TaxID=1867833 RepID=A0ABQ5XE28_9GAMM|nr:glycosyltransferase family 2 protein [Dyella flagellata]GLQ89562.1 glycosyl transferase [Dyella flagellata]
MTRIAVLVPCFNEAVSITRVVAEFKAALPTATIHVYDNNSTDNTIELAKSAGAIVRKQELQGKGHVVRRMFADIEADAYVLVDGDATYDPSAAPIMVQKLLEESLDMVVGTRVSTELEAYRRGHRFGNWLLTSLTGYIFGRTFTDMLSGYRVLSRRFVKSYPARAGGFEVETELTVHALEQHMPVAEHPTQYASRMDGSHSKLSTWRDGWRILATILKLTKNGKPLLFFGIAATLSMLIAVLLALPLLITYLHTGLVPRFPTAVLCSGLMVLAAIFLVCGLVLDTVTLGRRELKHLVYLAYQSPHPMDETD